MNDYQLIGKRAFGGVRNATQRPVFVVQIAALTYEQLSVSRKNIVTRAWRKTKARCVFLFLFLALLFYLLDTGRETPTSSRC
jgi:hypothetical protein